jgi:hypothetical protein
MGTFETKTYLQHHNPYLSVGLLVIYLFIMSVIMLNLLIALLTNAQQKVSPAWHASLLPLPTGTCMAVIHFCPAFSCVQCAHAVLCLSVKRDLREAMQPRRSGNRTPEGLLFI